jgi:small redox-active disulfide protein 2
MKIEVLGLGCLKCEQLIFNVEAVITEIGMEIEVSKVTDLDRIVAYGVMLMPALAVDGAVVSTGKVLSKDEIKKIITK